MRPPTPLFHLSTSPLSLALALLAMSSLSSATRSPKRGLIYVSGDQHPEDNAVWVQSGSDLTWYYNYRILPSTAFAGVSQDKLEFVPMMWGVDTTAPDRPEFLENVRGMMDDHALDIKHALAFNEPDSASRGGSSVAPDIAARAWVANFEPLRELGVRVGLPACTGTVSGTAWLRTFLQECNKLLSTASKQRNCTYDFLPLHWHDNFEGLVNHVSQRAAEYPNTDIWVTEFAYANHDLSATHKFFNSSTAYLDNLDVVKRYAYLGAFRSIASEVGPDAAFLNKDGELTDVGSWYLGGKATGVEPLSGSGAGKGWGQMSLGLVTGSLVVLSCCLL